MQENNLREVKASIRKLYYSSSHKRNTLHKEHLQCSSPFLLRRCFLYSRVREMRIDKILKNNDTDTYRKLNKMKQKPNKKENIELGDSVENLMRHDAYKRQGRRIKQTRWGK